MHINYVVTFIFFNYRISGIYNPLLSETIKSCHIWMDYVERHNSFSWEYFKDSFSHYDAKTSYAIILMFNYFGNICAVAGHIFFNRRQELLTQDWTMIFIGTFGWVASAILYFWKLIKWGFGKMKIMHQNLRERFRERLIVEEDDRVQDDLEPQIPPSAPPQHREIGPDEEGFFTQQLN